MNEKVDQTELDAHYEATVRSLLQSLGHSSWLCTFRNALRIGHGPTVDFCVDAAEVLKMMAEQTAGIDPELKRRIAELLGRFPNYIVLADRKAVPAAHSEEPPPSCLGDVQGPRTAEKIVLDFARKPVFDDSVLTHRFQPV